MKRAPEAVACVCVCVCGEGGGGGFGYMLPQKILNSRRSERLF